MSKSAVSCDLCGQDIEDMSSMDADAFGDARDRTSAEMFVLVRCVGCRVHTVVCDGGDT